MNIYYKQSAIWKTVIICLTILICRDSSFFLIKINNLQSLTTLKSKYFRVYTHFVFYPPRTIQCLSNAIKIKSKLSLTSKTIHNFVLSYPKLHLLFLSSQPGVILKCAKLIPIQGSLLCLEHSWQKHSRRISMESSVLSFRYQNRLP